MKTIFRRLGVLWDLEPCRKHSFDVHIEAFFAKKKKNPALPTVFCNCVFGPLETYHPVFVSRVCSAYQVVVEEERPRRARGTAEILRCYPVPIHFQNATLLNSQYYFTAQFPSGGIHSPQPFTVGDNKTYNGYWNAPLLPQKSYSIYYQAVSTANGVGVLEDFVFLFMSFLGTR